MDLSKMIKNLEAEQQETQPDGQQFSKEEYAAMKKPNGRKYGHGWMPRPRRCSRTTPL